MEASGRVGELGVREQERSPELEGEGLQIGAVQGGANQPQPAGLLVQLTGEQRAGVNGRQDSGVVIQLSGLQMQLDGRPLRQGQQNVEVLGQVSGVQGQHHVGLLEQQSGVQDVGIIGQKSGVQDLGVLLQHSGVQDVGVIGQKSGVQDLGVIVQQSGVQDVGVLGQLSAGQDVGVIEQQEESHVIRAQNLQKMAELAPELLESPLCPASRPVTDSHQYAFLVNADTSAEAQDLETSVEEMLIRLDEFCAMMDMIRSETSLIIDDRIPEIERRAEEMSKIYRQVEKLEAFVKMVGHHVSYLEEELIRAERDHLSFPHTVKKLLTGDYLPTFLQKNSKPQSTYELPPLYRTEDYFSASCKYKRNLD